MTSPLQRPGTGFILGEVLNEREKQDEMWGGPSHDDTHTDGEWTKLIIDRVVEAQYASDPALARRKLIAVAALTVAWIECHDREEERARL